MSGNEVHELASKGVYENHALTGAVDETHISWVILTRKFAFKIKKPVKLSFLDFSSIELRKKQCERELLLNRRFSDIYLSVMPIYLVSGEWIIGGDHGTAVVDYCVVMRRMAISKRLDNLLRKDAVNVKSIEVLASQVALFHNKAERIFIPFDIETTRNTFNDIQTIVQGDSNNSGIQLGEVIKRSIDWSDTFLGKYSLRMQQRIDHGLRRDVHGDLHSGNIFLYTKPVLFDCIEFNDEFRQIDVLYEIAFLCMDLERFHYKHLAEMFLNEYKKHFAAFQEREDDLIFIYFKCLRANIRAKVHALQGHQSKNQTEASFQISAMRRYLMLMNQYMGFCT
ncbi:MAG TPA: hypothetical protein VFT90_15425 [Chryseosolibacter sp.]|nr:hypothetical protein [Chryseosolibacter sp.]